MPAKKKQSKGTYQLKTRLSFSSIKSSPQKMAVLAAFALVFIGGGAVLVAGSHADASQMVCDINYTSASCLNRSGGGTGNGTRIIAWTRDWDNNENFTMATLPNYCGGGKVTSSCPFTVGSGLNTRYQGDRIMNILDYSDQTKCAIAQNPNSVVLGACNANGAIFVQNTPNGKGIIDYVENVYWSNQNYASGQYDTPGFLCDLSGSVVIHADLGNGYCQWASE
jgi:hypothetical protein